MASTSHSRENIQERQTLELNLDLSHHGRKAQVSVTVQPNTDPSLYGCTLLFPSKPSSTFANFPVCEATVRAIGMKGYGSMYGWVQMTRDSSHDWEMDPAPIFQGLDTPFCWFGPEPSLFDCPMRENVRDFDWTCHSFLAWLPDCLMSKDVRPGVGFEWGFWIEDGEVRVKALKRLGDGEWDGHLPMLREKFPSWTFSPHS
ncbi:uncharacterized protein LTR77_009693 [Saxophila tyrrhenica]|uniref:Uncharacterized protein n=1 Tax=Saxophila tyrrhenica TaxID=1690608 RepID=A0AAV9NX08_9PEZI|nr:hypothetical protein LTR77_009693 [Saxophila tyrrhenica]